jgi:hypothetical protein
LDVIVGYMKVGWLERTFRGWRRLRWSKRHVIQRRCTRLAGRWGDDFCDIVLVGWRHGWESFRGGNARGLDAQGLEMEEGERDCALKFEPVLM